MIKVKLLKNRRIYDDYATDLVITTGEIKTIGDRELQAYSMRGALFDGTLQVVEGDIITNIKKAKILFSEKAPLKCYGIDRVRGEKKYFTRDLITLDFTYYIEAGDMPIEFRNKLEGKVEPETAVDNRKLFEPEAKTEEKPFSVVDEETKIMTEADLKSLYKSEQVFIIKSLIKEKPPKYEDDRIILLLDLQKNGADLRNILANKE